MQRDNDAIRRRICDRIRDLHGDVTPATVKAVAERAKIEPTTLARFVLYFEDAERRTDAMRSKTLERVALALDVRAGWLIGGVGNQQLNFWPILVHTDAETELPAAPETQVQTAIRDLAALSLAVRTRACRAAVAAMLEVTAGAGEVMSSESYRSLMRLDAMQRAPQRKAR
jgi:hypothetical protein